MNAPPARVGLSLPGYLVDHIKTVALAERVPRCDVAGRLLKEVLPHVQANWANYTWPAPRSPWSGHHASLEVSVPRPVYTEYQEIAIQLLMRSIAAGTDNSKRDPVDGKWAGKPPIRWLLRRALVQAYESNMGPRAPEIVERRVKADGPLMSCKLPTVLVEWARKRGTLSAFIREALEYQLSVIAVHDRVPPKSALLYDRPETATAFRTSREYLGYLIKTATQYQVSRSHVVRAACLMHYAYLTARQKASTQPKVS
jgi:hypothetical protein